MNTLRQNENYLLGSEESIKALAEKETSSILLVSDSHGALFVLTSILKEFGQRCDALIFTGDGMSDLTACFEEALYEKSFSSCLPPVAGFVAGNNDTDMYPCVNPDYTPDNGQNYYGQIKVPLRNVLTASGHKIFFTHGHRYSLYNGTDAVTAACRDADAEVAVFGHTHVPSWEVKYPCISVINPGSCSRPRQLTPPSFAILNLKMAVQPSDVVFYRITGRGFEPFIPKTPYESFSC